MKGLEIFSLISNMRADLRYASARLCRARLVGDGKNWVTVDKMGHPLHPTPVSLLAKFLLKLNLNFLNLTKTYLKLHLTLIVSNFIIFHTFFKKSGWPILPLVTYFTQHFPILWNHSSYRMLSQSLVCVIIDESSQLIFKAISLFLNKKLKIR